MDKRSYRLVVVDNIGNVLVEHFMFYAGGMKVFNKFCNMKHTRWIGLFDLVEKTIVAEYTTISKGG